MVHHTVVAVIEVARYSGTPHCSGSHGGGQVHYTGNVGGVIKASCKLGVVKQDFTEWFVEMALYIWVVVGS